jgi:hypothetical protein
MFSSGGVPREVSGVMRHRPHASFFPPIDQLSQVLTVFREILHETKS